MSSKRVNYFPVYMKRFLKKYVSINYKIVVILVLFVVLLLSSLIIAQKGYENKVEVKTEDQNQLKFINDLKFDHNISGYPINIVPNIVHYILFTVHEVEFGHFVSILSVLRNQRPEKVYIHCDCDQLVGEYYKRVLRVANKINTKLIVRRIERPTEIFGQKLSKGWINFHGSDITRIRVLQEFGGIYLDRDVYVVRPLDMFRKYEMTLNWDLRQYLGTQILIAHKNARFLQLWLNTYHSYNPKLWYFNAGELPTKAVLYDRPELVHRVLVRFGVDCPDICPKVFSRYFKDWQKDYDTIHLYVRGDHISQRNICLQGNHPNITKLDDLNAPKLNVTFGEMTRLLLDFEKSL